MEGRREKSSAQRCGHFIELEKCDGKERTIKVDQGSLNVGLAQKM
jgi:hypothetical protein